MTVAKELEWLRIVRRDLTAALVRARRDGDARLVESLERHHNAATSAARKLSRLEEIERAELHRREGLTDEPSTPSATKPPPMAEPGYVAPDWYAEHEGYDELVRRAVELRRRLRGLR